MHRCRGSYYQDGLLVYTEDRLFGWDKGGDVTWTEGLMREGGGGRSVEAAVRMAFASYAVWSSSRRDGKAWEISGLMEARVHERNSVPYRCLTSLGSSGLINRSQVSMTKFSREGDISSSSVARSPW